MLGLGQKLMKTGMFGFRKKDVQAYLESLGKSYASKLAEKEDQIARYVEENEQLKKRLNDLEGRAKTMEEERDYIANAIIQAEQKAQRMMESAEQAAAQRREELEEEIQADVRRSGEIKRQLTSLQQEALSVMRDYEKKLGLLTEEDGAETEPEPETAPDENEATAPDEETADGPKQA